MHTSAVSTSPTTGFEPLRLGVHALAAVAIGLVAPFTALAWPFALLVGIALGVTETRRMRGAYESLADGVLTGIAVILGILGMILFGVIIGGFVAILVVVLAIFSERAAAYASPIDRGIARILLVAIPVAMWLFVFPLIGLDVHVRIGG